MIERSSHFSEYMTSMIHVTTYTLYKGLMAFALAQKTQEKKWEKHGQRALQNMKKWAKHAPSNYLHKAMLLEAEHAAIQGKVSKTIKLYDIAISHAKQHGYIQEEALAYERAALFFNSLNRSDKSAWYFARSHQLYIDWGANAKANVLHAQFSSLVVPAKHRDSFHLFVRGRSSISPNVGISQIEMAAADTQLSYSEKEITDTKQFETHPAALTQTAKKKSLRSAAIHVASSLRQYFH
mmetsp:Transcript_17635/g.22454  ORF Transcript_17635/g.22454 Transcript_17635/m.22454 type:complete len:238 (-) Transcript_17635:176-889(-)